MASGASYRIGDWTFHPQANELVRGDERRRLEDRAARTLALLCAHAGEPVSQERIIAEVWNGRSQSPNSVPVVIGQLRKALGDEARNARFIETVPKRGYRLVTGVTAAGTARLRPRRALLVLAAIAAAAAIFILLRPAPPQLAVADVVNETGQPRYDALAKATSELIAARLSRSGIVYRRGTHADADLQLAAKLVLWNAEPTVSLSATDENGLISWSAMARGPAPAIAGNVTSAVDSFAATFPREDRGRP